MNYKSIMRITINLVGILALVLIANLEISHAASRKFLEQGRVGHSESQAAPENLAEKFNLNASENYIVINTTGIVPNTVVINVGDTVTWHNATQQLYTVVSGEALFGTAAPTGNFVYLPLITQQGGQNLVQLAMERSTPVQEEGEFQKTLAPGEDFTYTFNTARTISFHIAENINFFGSIIVEAIDAIGISRTSPADGENDVAVTRETIIEFDAPISANSVTASNFQATFGSETLDTRLHHSANGKRVTFFYNDPLPASARVQVTVNGDSVADENGNLIDADGDGTAGGLGQFHFDTLSLTTLAGTSVCGRVFASELEQIEAAHVSVNQPLQGATITVDGQEDRLRAVTDASGNFCLDPAPAGRFFVHIDGRTATNGIPAGAYYPFVGKAWESTIGQQTNVGNIHLPLINAGTLQDVSANQETRITFAPSVADAFPELQGTEILVPAGSLFADNGSEGGKVGISPVPPDRLPGQLPPGLNFPIVITVQTDGATNFDVPAPVCFPNLPDSESGEKLGPGEKSALWSFNHDTGRFEIIGSMTVGDDGQLVCTDPGVGIEAPGWHGSRPGTPPGKNDPNDPNDPSDPRCDVNLNHCVYASLFGALDCAASFIPLAGAAACSFGLMYSGGAATRDCIYGDLGGASCVQSIGLNFFGGALGCLSREIPGLGNVLACGTAADSMGKSCSCSTLVNASAVDDSQERFALYLDLLQAYREFYMVSLGSDVWTNLDLTKGDSIALGEQVSAILAQAAKFTAVESDEKHILSTAEIESLLALPRPDHLSADDITRLADYLNTTHLKWREGVNLHSMSDSSNFIDRDALIAAADKIDEALKKLETFGETAINYSEVFNEYITCEIDRFSNPTRVSTKSQLRNNSALSFAITQNIHAEFSQNAILNPEDIYYVLTHETLKTIFRGKLRSDYRFNILSLQPNSLYRVAYLHAPTLYYGSTTFLSAESGVETQIPPVMLYPISESDAETLSIINSDSDKLFDIAEYVIGTSIDKNDSDDDGTEDDIELQLGTNPLGDIAIATGIIATADTPGTAVDICAVNDLIAIADSDAGVALFNVFNGMNPTIINQMDTPGDAHAVACGHDQIVVADGIAGLAIIDVMDPSNAQLTQQLEYNGTAKAVAIAGNSAYVGVDSRLIAVDLDSGATQAELDFETTIQDITIIADVLYVLTREQVHALPLTPSELRIVSTIESSGSVGAGRRHLRLFGTHDILYVTHTRGYNTFDISVPLQPNLIAAGETDQFGWKQIVTNGAGLGIAAVSANSTNDGIHNISLYDVNNPTQTNQFITTFETPGVAAAVTLYNGQAYIADSNAGMQVINYLSADTEGITPTISIATNFASGVAEERASMYISADARDDVQIRNVEFYIDGNRVALDGNYPFEAWITTPALADQSAFTLQAKATDTGGNSVWNSTETIELVADATPPRITETTPKNRGFISPDTLTEISVAFNEPMDPGTLQDANVQLFEAGIDKLLGTDDDQPISLSAAYDGENTTMTLNLANPLGEGRYRVIVDGNMTDVAGNPIKGGEYAWPFTVGIAVWDGGGDNKSWHDPLNWEIDQVPGEGAVVLIDSAGEEQILYNRDDNIVTSIHSIRPFELRGGTLTINNASTFNRLIHSNGTLSGTGNITVTDVLTWSGGEMSGSGKTTAQNRLVVDEGRVDLDGRTLENGGTALLRRSQGSLSQHIVFKNGGILNNLAGATFHDQSSGQFSMDSLLDHSTPMFNNMGTYILDIPIEADFNRRSMDIRFNNLGTVQILSGELSLSGEENINKGEIEITDGANLSMGGIPFLFTIDIGSKISGDGVLRTRAGTVDIKTDITLANLIHGNAILTGTGDIQVTEVFTWADGTIGGSGTIRSEGQLYLRGPSLVLDGRVFDNAGTALWRWDTDSLLRRSLHLRNGAIFNNLADATFIDEEARERASIAIWGDSNATIPQFNNAGMYIKRGNPNETVIEASLNNPGKIHVQSGILRLKDGSNSNIIDIDENATVKINGIFDNQEDGQFIGTGMLDITNSTFTDNGTIAPSITIVP